MLRHTWPAVGEVIARRCGPSLAKCRRDSIRPDQIIAPTRSAAPRPASHRQRSPNRPATAVRVLTGLAHHSDPSSSPRRRTVTGGCCIARPRPQTQMGRGPSGGPVRSWTSCHGAVSSCYSWLICPRLARRFPIASALTSKPVASARTKDGSRASPRARARSTLEMTRHDGPAGVQHEVPDLVRDCETLARGCVHRVDADDCPLPELPPSPWPGVHSAPACPAGTPSGGNWLPLAFS